MSSMEMLEPRLVLCGHMHERYRNRVTLESGKTSEICCLANITQGRDAIAVYRLGTDGEIEEIWSEETCAEALSREAHA